MSKSVSDHCSIQAVAPKKPTENSPADKIKKNQSLRQMTRIVTAIKMKFPAIKRVCFN